jgi:hypothetical protein
MFHAIILASLCALVWCFPIYPTKQAFGVRRESPMESDRFGVATFGEDVKFEYDNGYPDFDFFDSTSFVLPETIGVNEADGMIYAQYGTNPMWSWNSSYIIRINTKLEKHIWQVFPKYGKFEKSYRAICYNFAGNSDLPKVYGVIGGYNGFGFELLDIETAKATNIGLIDIKGMSSIDSVGYNAKRNVALVSATVAKDRALFTASVNPLKLLSKQILPSNVQIIKALSYDSKNDLYHGFQTIANETYLVSFKTNQADGSIIYPPKSTKLDIPKNSYIDKHTAWSSFDTKTGIYHQGFWLDQPDYKFVFVTVDAVNHKTLQISLNGKQPEWIFHEPSVNQ